MLLRLSISSSFGVFFVLFCLLVSFCFALFLTHPPFLSLTKKRAIKSRCLFIYRWSRPVIKKKEGKGKEKKRKRWASRTCVYGTFFSADSLIAERIPLMRNACILIACVTLIFPTRLLMKASIYSCGILPLLCGI